MAGLPCEAFQYNITFIYLRTLLTHQGVHHRRYYLTVGFTNNAGLVTTVPVDILVDVSPPTRGVVLEGGSSDQTEVDYTSQSRVHVYWHGFADHESGVLLYRVVLAYRCLTDAEMDTSDNATEVTPAQGNTTTFHLNSTGRYFTTVVAYNGALTPSLAACSDGIVYDTSAPQLRNVTLTHARAPRSISCPRTASGDVTAWLINNNLTRVQLDNSSACQSLCRQGNATASVEHLPLTTVFGLGAQESDDLCRSLPKFTEDSWIILPSDRLLLTWAAADDESEMEDFGVGVGSSISSSASPDLIPMTSTHLHHTFHRSHPGLGHGSIFYLFLEATSKSSLQTLLTVGPILVDSTPAHILGPLEVKVVQDHLEVTVDKGQVFDPEQPTEIDMNFSYRVGHPEGFVTPFLPASSSDVAECRRQNASVEFCARVPLASLREHDSRVARAFFFQLHVQNAAGHVTSVNSSSVKLPPMVPDVVVFDVVGSGEVTDVDVMVESDVVCMAWSDVTPLGWNVLGSTIQVEVGIGTSNSTDDVIPFYFADVSKGGACVNVTSLTPYVRLYSVIRVSVNDPNGRHSAVSASDGFVAVPRGDPDNKMQVFFGQGCSDKDLLAENVVNANTLVFNISTSPHPLHPGDVVFVALHPFVPGVLFTDTTTTLTTLTGYQVVLGSDQLTLQLPTPASSSTTVRVYACRREQNVLHLNSGQSPLYGSWEMVGPWSGLYTYLRAELLDIDCLQLKQQQNQNVTAGGNSSVVFPTFRDLSRQCLVAESRVLPHHTSIPFSAELLFEGRAYVASLAPCFDDDVCLDDVISGELLVTSTRPLLTVDDAQLLNANVSYLDLQVSLSGQSLHGAGGCAFLVSVSRSQYAAHLLSPWKLFSRNESCSSLQLREMLVVEASHTDGTLYLCVRLVFPWYTDSTLCHTITRHPQSSKVQPFHVMELSHDTLITVDLDPYIGSQQLGDRLHEAHDLDIDFARSDLLLSALVTNSGGRQITWFLMEGNRTFPGGDSCAGDPACVTTASTAPSTSNFVVYYSSSVREGAVTFSRQSSQLRHGSVYYVCAILLPRELGQGNFLSGYNEEQRVCGDGIVIDDENPVAGTVSILNGDSGYLADGGVVTVTWSGFSDVENDVTAELPDDTTLSYSVALGTYPGAEDLARFASVGQRTAWTFERLHVQSGIFCYGTVKATDRVGHVTEVTSQAVILDNTPPSVGLVRVGSILGERFVSGHELTVHWEEVADEESGIASQWVAVSMRGGHDDVIPFTKVEGTWHVLNGSDVLVDGHSYVVLIKSTNRAGLSSVTSSEPFVVDTSSPVAGAVWNGPPGSNEHLSYQTDAHTYSAHWSDFSDPHTGVQYYRAGLGTQPGQDDVAPFHYAGLRTEYTWREQLDQGREYYAVVEACNNADLCTAASSSSLLFDNSPPSSGHVIVGVDGRHTGFYGHNTTLQVRWTGFADPQSGIREFLWCVGTQPNLCDVKPIATSLLEYAVSGAVTSLPVGSPLYVTVRAINFAGLWAEGVSEKFVVDLTPPELLQPPTFTLSGSKASALRAQWDRSLVHLTWAFRDTLAPIVSTTLTLRGEVQGRHATAEPVFVGSDGHATLQLGKEDLLMDGDRYRATVVVCNAAQLCTTATSPYLLLDSTPPVVGRFEPQLRWNITIVVVSTTAAPAINTTAAPSTPSTLTNVTTATTTAAPPLTTPVTMVEVKWAEFADAESDVIAYHVTVGRSESDTDLSGGVVTVPHDSSIATQTMVLSMGNNSLTAGDLVVLCIRAENGLGLLSELLCLTFEVLLDTASGDSGLLELQRHSCVPHYCTNECTCAPTGQECTPTAGSAACTDLPSNHSSLAGWSISPVLLHRASPATFLTSAKCLEGNWTVNVQQGSPTVVRYRYSFSREGLAAGEDVMDPLKEPIWRDAGLRTSALYCLPDDRMLLSGYSYVMHLQLWLSRHTYVTVTSPALVVDLSPPFRGRGRSVNESVSSSCAGRDVDFLTQQSSVTSCWSGVFSDAQSNITRYDVWMGSTPDADDYMKIRNVGRNTSAEIDVTSMTDGTRYYVSIRAWNGAGLSTTAESDGVLRDLTAPTLGQIFLASRHAADHATDDATALPVTWHGFQDLQSGVTSYSVALYDVQDFVTPVVGFHDVGFVTKYLLKGLSLQQEHSYMAAVKARNAAGLESTSAFSAAILVDVTPPEGTGCSQFQLEAESSVPLVVNQSDFSFRPVTYSTSLTASVAKKHKLLKVMVLSTTPLPRGAEGEAVLEPHLRLPLHFRYNSSQLATADVVFLAPSSGTVNISVTVQAENGASFQARLVSCVAEQAVAPSASWSASSSSSTVNVGAIASREAVVLQQETVNKMKVTSLVIDAESEVMSLRVGLGTTPGGLQAVPLTPLGQTGHVMLEVNVPHGTQLFATLLAQNHAGTWSRFVSQPVVMDTTPPIIDQLHVTIDYVRNANGVNVTSATVLASWDAVDVGSGDVSCSCRLEGHATHDDVTQYQDVVSGGRCQWRLLKPRHDAHVRVVIGCMNGVQISTTATSQDVIVLVETPSVSQANVQFLNNYRQFSPYEHVTPDLRSSTSDLEMTWSDSGDDTVDHFRYRVLVNDVSVAGWSPLPVYKTSAIVGAGSTLPGVNVTAEVTAVNTEGVTSAVMSRTAVIDDSLPILTGKKATGSLANNELTLSWAGVFQTVHDVTFAVFAGTQDGLGNVINNAVTKDTVYRGPCDVSLAKVYVIVQAVYCNGLEETYKDVVYI